MREYLEINKAMSMNDGVIFYSKRHEGHCIIATINEQGNIKTKLTTNEIADKEYDENIQKNFNFVSKVLFLIGGVMAIIAFLICTAIIMQNLILGIKALFTAMVIIVIVSIIIIVVFGNGGGNVSKVHAAEHKVLNAYRDLGRVPTLDEVNSYSRFSKYCGTVIAVRWLMYSVGLLLCFTIINIIWLPVVAIVIDIIFWILQNVGLIKYFQVFTTKEPTDRELMLVIEGMKAWVKKEQR